MTKIIAISDLHGNLPKIYKCDLLLIAGDLTPTHNHNIYYQANWLNHEFRDWIGTTPATHRVVCAGNHDFVFQKNPGLVNESKYYHYLQDNGVEIEGLKIWATPWQPSFYDWAFNLNEPDLLKRWELIPDNTDILVVHGPPHGYGDKAPRMNGAGYEHTGSPGLTERIRRIKPKLVVTGHIHEARGVYDLDGTIVANASILNGQYVHVHEPLMFEIGKRRDGHEINNAPVPDVEVTGQEELP